VDHVLEESASEDTIGRADIETKAIVTERALSTSWRRNLALESRGRNPRDSWVPVSRTGDNRRTSGTKARKRCVHRKPSLLERATQTNSWKLESRRTTSRSRNLGRYILLLIARQDDNDDMAKHIGDLHKILRSRAYTRARSLIPDVLSLSLHKKARADWKKDLSGKDVYTTDSLKERNN